jgi:hypothetical protein
MARIRTRGRLVRATGFPLATTLVLLLAAVRPALANSVFSSAGLGEPSLEENARLRALGGAGVAEHGVRDFSLVNPASIAECKQLILEATALSTRRSISTPQYGSETANEMSFPSVRLVVMLPGHFVLGGSYVIGTNGEFHVTRPESSGTASVLTIDGSGGIEFARATLARTFRRNFRLGVDVDVIGGSYREEWSRDFLNPSLATTRDTLEVGWDRLARWRFGAQYVRSRFALGAMYETGRSLPLTIKQKTPGSSVVDKSKTLEYPAGFAAGLQFPLGGRARVVSQYRRTEWAESSLESDLVDFRAEERYSFGIERTALPFGSTLDKMPIRIGGTVIRWPDLLPVPGASDVSGGVAAVEEWTVSLGTGIATSDRGAMVDVSFEGGVRGDEERLGAKETVFRIGISLQVGDETWK